MGRNATLTDRTLIWDAALAAKTNPLIGTGFDSFWLTHYADRITEEFHVPHAHNGYLETYLNTGSIGVLLLLVVFFRAGKNATREVVLGSTIGHLFLAFVLVALIYNYTEVTFGRSNVMGLVIWLVAVYGPESFVDYRPERVELASDFLYDPESVVEMSPQT
jgi:O-antigen ligase